MRQLRTNPERERFAKRSEAEQMLKERYCDAFDRDDYNRIQGALRGMLNCICAPSCPNCRRWICEAALRLLFLWSQRETTKQLLLIFVDRHNPCSLDERAYLLGLGIISDGKPLDLDSLYYSAVLA